MNHLIFDYIEFKGINYQQWKQRYKSSIRISIELGKIKRPKTGFLVADEKTNLKLCWYKKGNYRDGEIKKASIGNKNVLIRIPAIKINDEYLVIDGCHRLTQLKPRFILIDYIEPKKEDLRYISDCFNDYWLSKWYNK